MKKLSRTRSARRKTRSDRGPSIEALRALLVLAEAGSVTETARRLGLSQPVISNKLQVFKKNRASGPLLVRSDGRLELTDEARAVLPAIRELVARYDRLLSYMKQDATSPQVLRIGSGMFAAEHYLPIVMQELSSILEDCQIETHVCRGRDRILGTARGALDVSIVTHDSWQVKKLLREERLPDSLLEVRKLGRHPMCVLAAIDSAAGRDLHALDKTSRVPTSKLEQWELIGPDRDSGFRRRIESRVKGAKLYFVSEGGGWVAAKEYARRAIGVALVPLATIAGADEVDLVIRRLRSQFDVTDYLLTRKGEASGFLMKTKKAIAAAVRAQTALYGSSRRRRR